MRHLLPLLWTQDSRLWKDTTVFVNRQWKIFLTEYKRPTSSGAKSIPEIPEEYQWHHGRDYYSLHAGCSATNGKHWNKPTNLIHRNSELLGHLAVG